MRGKIGEVVRLAANGDQDSMEKLTGLFGPMFHTPNGWNSILGRIHGGTVAGQLRLDPIFWEVETFQALYVASWIHHPIEKGTFMIGLTNQEADNVKAACKKLLKEKEVSKRISSHMGTKGFSASRGWNFLSGYGELLVQLEKGETIPYLFLKSEGHPLRITDPVGTGKHMKAWIKKKRTGEGEMANPALHELARSAPSLVELRAAENYSLDYKALLKQLNLKGKLIAVGTVVAALCERLEHSILVWKYDLDEVSGDARLLGQAMLDPNDGYLKIFRSEQAALARQKVQYTEGVDKELTGLAQRLAASPISQPDQVFNEIRVSPADLDQSLATFRALLTSQD